MGAGSSTRRRNHHQSAPPPQYSSSALYPPPGSYAFAANAPYPIPYSHPSDPYPPPHAYHTAHYYHHGPGFSNPINTSMIPPVVGRQNYPQAHGGWSYGMRPSPWAGAPPPPPSPPPYVEQQKATTIRNDVNLKKETLRLERDENDPDRYLVAFTFDSTVSGSISIFFFAKEGSNCSLTALKPYCPPIRVAFSKGLGQKFRQPSGTGIDISLFDEGDLTKEGPDEVFPLVIRAEACSTNHAADASDTANQTIGNPLPKSINAQITQAVLEKKDSGEYRVKVVKQILWADGTRYELQEIYGIGSSAGADFDGNDPGKECVICMSEPRDTTVLPCRHMCMCSECAKVLRFQTNRCPICRRPVERLMEIKVN